jgi:hypothetical protein
MDRRIRYPERQTWNNDEVAEVTHAAFCDGFWVGLCFAIVLAAAVGIVRWVVG